MHLAKNMQTAFYPQADIGLTKRENLSPEKKFIIRSGHPLRMIFYDLSLHGKQVFTYDLLSCKSEIVNFLIFTPVGSI